MPTTSTTPRPGHRTHRIRRTLARPLVLALAAATALSAPTAAAAETGGSSPLRDKQLIIAVGKGQVTDEPPFCFTGAPGPCGLIVQGTHKGSPIRSGTFFAMIDNGNAASPRRCVPATFSGLLYATPDDAIAQVSEGKVRPHGAGGYVFTGRFDGASGTGQFREVSKGSGRLRVTVAANGSATLTLAGRLRVGQSPASIRETRRSWPET
jgi:hypothetical protein